MEVVGAEFEIIHHDIIGHFGGDLLNTDESTYVTLHRALLFFCFFGFLFRLVFLRFVLLAV